MARRSKILLKPRKHSKTKASPIPVLSPEVLTPIQETIPETVVVESSASDHISKSAPLPPVEIAISPTDSPVEPVTVQSSTRSSLSQGDFFCTVIAEGDILDIETIREAPGDKGGHS
ncbi:hypothetical protein AMTR_s00083p00066470 [Amborella trichopoda]|uniref:Uncharacterized protein n=1 Tax=Amborella trichopoda TaxID=13333 RepID=W1P4K2_AMBTC|nr:hypothetical protein AMTR_s00083p00066470 [Amborella trichopoda]